ncbi:hypothetical protein [Streptosporangium sp. NPDC006930]|uniref:hypothetical protein n=1 Tax=unclassified Streptosporangium TaxID=2632669 RepID=UPI00343BCBF7
MTSDEKANGLSQVGKLTVGWAAGQIAVARMAAERAERAGLVVRALVLPRNVYPDGGTAYGYPIMHADVDTAGVFI